MGRRGLERLSRDLRTGVLAVLILALLVEKGELHGYEARRLLGERLGYMPPESSVYDALKRLEKLGLAESYWARSSQGTMRKYYRARPGAREALQQLLEELSRMLGWLLCRSPGRPS